MKMSRKREHRRVGIGYCNSVLEVGSEAVVESANGPAIGVRLRVPVADRDHGLERQNHALAEDWSAVRWAEVRHLGLFVHLAADAVAHVFAHDAIALALDVLADCVGHDAKFLARPGRSYPVPERLLRNIKQPLGFRRDLPDRHRKGVVADET